MITKKVEPTGDMCIKFSDEELQILGIKEGDKFSFEIQDDDSVLLKKFESIELDLAEFSRESLETLIQLSCEDDVSVNEVISNLLEQFINKYENGNKK